MSKKKKSKAPVILKKKTYQMSTYSENRNALN